MTESKLLPCPFCGGRAQQIQNYGGSPGYHGRFISCMGCGANIFRYRPEPMDADAALVEAWNLRLTHPEAQGNKDLGEPAASGLEEEVLGHLTHAVQYRGKEYGVSPLGWRTMAAFDSDLVAERYAAKCESETWEYRVIPLLQARSAAPTTQPINGESELESASNGMGLR